MSYIDITNVLSYFLLFYLALNKGTLPYDYIYIDTPPTPIWSNTWGSRLYFVVGIIDLFPGSSRPMATDTLKFVTLCILVTNFYLQQMSLTDRRLSLKHNTHQPKVKKPIWSWFLSVSNFEKSSSFDIVSTSYMQTKYIHITLELSPLYPFFSIWIPYTYHTQELSPLYPYHSV